METTPQRRGRSGVVLALLSTVLPGAGQLAAGRRARGAALVGLAVLPALAIAAWLRADDASSLSRIADTRVLAVLIALVAFVALLRAIAAVDALLLGRRAGVGGLLVVGAALAVATGANAVVAWYAWQATDTIATVFQAAEPDVAEPVGGNILDEVATLPPLPPESEPAASEPLPATSTEEPAATSAEEPAASSEEAPPASTAEEPAPATTAEAPAKADEPPADAPPWVKRGRVTVLLLGGDAGYGRYGLRTDTMIVASMDLRTRFAALFSVPRNMQRVPLSGVLAEHLGSEFEPILNELYDEAHGHPEWFPHARDPGAAALKQTLADLTGLPIDYYVLVDLKGFYEVVKAFDGVTIDVPEPVLDRLSPPEPGMDWIRIDLQPGVQHLSPEETFAYVRARSESSDWSRIKRQRCVLAALAGAASPQKVARILPRLLRTFRDNVSTDIPRSALPDLVDLAAGLRPRNVLSYGFVPPDFTAYGGPDLEAIHDLVREVVRRPAGKPSDSAAGDACASA